MAESGKKVEVRFGAFSCSVEGYDNPVEQMREVMLLMQRMIHETPGLADHGPGFGEDEVARIEHALDRRAERQADGPGIVVIRGPESAQGGGPGAISGRNGAAEAHAEDAVTTAEIPPEGHPAPNDAHDASAESHAATAASAGIFAAPVAEDRGSERPGEPPDVDPGDAPSERPLDDETGPTPAAAAIFSAPAAAAAEAAFSADLADFGADFGADGDADGDAVGDAVGHAVDGGTDEPAPRAGAGPEAGDDQPSATDADTQPGETSWPGPADAATDTDTGPDIGPDERKDTGTGQTPDTQAFAAEFPAEISADFPADFPPTFPAEPDTAPSAEQPDETPPAPAARAEQANHLWTAADAGAGWIADLDADAPTDGPPPSDGTGGATPAPSDEDAEAATDAAPGVDDQWDDREASDATAQPDAEPREAAPDTATVAWDTGASDDAPETPADVHAQASDTAPDDAAAPGWETDPTVWQADAGAEDRTPGRPGTTGDTADGATAGMTGGDQPGEADMPAPDADRADAGAAQSTTERDDGDVQDVAQAALAAHGLDALAESHHWRTDTAPAPAQPDQITGADTDRPDPAGPDARELAAAISAAPPDASAKDEPARHVDPPSSAAGQSATAHRPAVAPFNIFAAPPDAGPAAARASARNIFAAPPGADATAAPSSALNIFASPPGAAPAPEPGRAARLLARPGSGQSAPATRAPEPDPTRWPGHEPGPGAGRDIDATAGHGRTGEAGERVNIFAAPHSAPARPSGPRPDTPPAAALYRQPEPAAAPGNRPDHPGIDTWRSSGNMAIGHADDATDETVDGGDADDPARSRTGGSTHSPSLDQLESKWDDGLDGGGSGHAGWSDGLREPPRPGLPSAGGERSRFSALLARLGGRGDGDNGGGGDARPSATQHAGPGAMDATGDEASPADLAERAGATSVADLLAVAAAWLTLVEGKPRFTRREVMETFERLPGDHPRTLEARIKGFGKLVRASTLILVDDGVFAMAQAERDRYQAMIDGD